MSFVLERIYGVAMDCESDWDVFGMRWICVWPLTGTALTINHHRELTRDSQAEYQQSRPCHDN